MRKLTDYPLWAQIAAIPIAWILMILKVLIVIPVYIVGRCNDIMSRFDTGSVQPK
jgi:hypothetical protein